MTPDVHTLTGAYVLDAVSDDERADFERHLRECESCAREVRELRATATRLGRAAAADPPPGLRAAVMDQVRRVRQDPPEARVIPLRRPGSLALRVTGAAAAVAVVAAVTFGVLFFQERQRTEDALADGAAMAQILRAGDARVTTQGGDGATMTVLSSRTADRALLLARNLPELDGGRVYQAWTIGEDVKPAGTISGGTAALEVAGIDSADAIGITVEPAGGSARPTTPTVMEFGLA